MSERDRKTGAGSVERTAPRSHPVQEEDRVPGRRVLLVAAATLAVTLGAIGFSVLEVAPLWSTPQALPEAARLSEPERIGRVYQNLIPSEQGPEAVAEARKRLRSYGWVDESQGLVRIPISRAMALRVSQENGS